MTPSVPAGELEAAYRRCALITRQRARNFYYGLRLTPEPRRSAIYSVYAWMRHADDIADADTPAVSIDDRLRSLHDFAERTRGVIHDSGSEHDDPVLAAFARTVKDYGLDDDDIRGMVEGLETDLEFERDAGAAHGRPMFDDRAAFERYCFRVASTVGRICVRIWGTVPGVDEANAMELAVLRGLAFQTTNILRDFREDFVAGRVYLPRDLFERHELTPGDLRAWNDPARCGAMIREACAWAADWYETSAPLDAMITPECRPAIRAMTRIYASLLGIIDNDPARVAGERRVRVTSWRKAVIALGAVRGARLRA